MKFKNETFPDVTFDDFCEKHGIEVVVRERAGMLGNPRYYATCDDLDTMESDGMLCGELGNGSAKEEAVLNYSRRLLGKKIVLGARGSSRREVQCPNAWKE